MKTGINKYVCINLCKSVQTKESEINFNLKGLHIVLCISYPQTRNRNKN